MKDLTDPLHVTSPEVNRRVFVGLSSGAALGAATFGTALGRESALGKPHPPIVSEDDPAIVVERVSLKRPDRTIGAYAAWPKNAGPATPGVVVVMHIWGIDTSIRDVVRRFAKGGYATIAPDLYARFDAPSGDGATDYKPFADISAKMSDAQVDGDLRSGAQWLKERHAHAKLGVTGFCMGGSITLRQAIDCADLFSAAAMWYGKVRYATGSAPGSLEGPATKMALAYADEVRAPLCGSFGERDKSIPAQDVRDLATLLRVPHDIKVYPEAGHGFFDDQRDSYVATAAADAWERLLRFFATHLRADR